MNRLLPIVCLAVAACAEDPPGRAPLSPAQPTLAQPTVVLVVFDTVRADHLSLCGYARPTSPVLAAFASGEGTTHTCRAYAPGSWTLPSHASYFTGLPVDEHGAHMVSGGLDIGGDWLSLRPLDDGPQTLAEAMKGRGYQSVLVSANPVVGPVSGLARGFDVVHVAAKFGQLRGEEMAAQLRTTLTQEVDPERPLLVVVNLSEAHDPLVNPPAGHAWYDPADHPARRSMRTMLREFELWKHPDPAATARWFTDLYDVGIQGADATFGRVVETLDETGWLAGDHRITVTADHGEHLGAFGFFGHGGDTLEPNTRVMLVHRQVPAAPLVLSEPFPGLAIHALVRDGALPRTLPAAEAMSLPWAEKAQKYDGQTAQHPDASLWEGWNKHRTVGGVRTTVDLLEDPLERAGAIPTAPLQAQLAALEARLTAAAARPVELDPELVEMLKAAGYMGGD